MDGMLFFAIAAPLAIVFLGWFITTAIGNFEENRRREAEEWEKVMAVRARNAEKIKKMEEEFKEWEREQAREKREWQTKEAHRARWRDHSFDEPTSRHTPEEWAWYGKVLRDIHGATLSEERLREFKEHLAKNNIKPSEPPAKAKQKKFHINEEMVSDVRYREI